MVHLKKKAYSLTWFLLKPCLTLLYISLQKPSLPRSWITNARFTGRLAWLAHIINKTLYFLPYSLMIKKILVVEFWYRIKSWFSLFYCHKRMFVSNLATYPRSMIETIALCTKRKVTYNSIYLYVLQILILLIVPRTAQYHVFFFYDMCTVLVDKKRFYSYYESKLCSRKRVRNKPRCYSGTINNKKNSLH